MLESVGKC